MCRFLEVAELLNVRSLDIRGKLQTKLLSQKTTYVAYFVFKFANGTSGRELANTSIKYWNKRKNVTYKEANTVAPQIQICGWGFQRLHSTSAGGWNMKWGHFSTTVETWRRGSEVPSLESLVLL